MRKGIGMVVLLAVALVTTSLSTVVKPLNIENSNSDLMQVDKKVWNGSEWVDETTADIGDKVRFNISISQPDDSGGYILYNITVRDTLPSGLEYVAGSGEFSGCYSGDAEPSIIGNTLVWELEDSIHIGEGEKLYITFEANVTDYGKWTNLVNVTANHCSGVKVYGEAIANVTVEEIVPEISVEKLVSLDGDVYSNEVTTTLGSEITFKIIVEDTGGTGFDNITIVDDLPDGLAYVEGTSRINGVPEEPNISDSELTWKVENPSEFPIIVIFNATVNGCGLLENIVDVEALIDCTLVSGNDSALANVTCFPGVEVRKYVSTDGTNWMDHLEGYLPEIDKVYFKINVTNTGDINLTGKLEDFLPLFLKYNGDGGHSYANDTYVRWNLTDPLPPGASIEKIFSATPISGGEGNNVATVTTDQGVNATDKVTIVLYEPSIEVSKVVRGFCPETGWGEIIEVIPGQIVEFRIDILYHGSPLDPLKYVFHNITIVDRLPDILEYQKNSTRFSGDWSGWDENYSGNLEPTIDDNNLTWYLGDVFRIPDGGTLSLYFRAIVKDDDGCGVYENVAEVRGEECSGMSLYDEDNASIEIPCPEVEIEKKARDPGTGEWKDSIGIFYGDEMTFNITVSNSGGRDIQVKVIDPLLDTEDFKLEYVSAEPEPDEIIDNTLIWNITVGAGEEFYIEITARFTGRNCYGCYNNTAYLYYTVGDQIIEKFDNATFCIVNDAWPPHSYVNAIAPYWHNKGFTVTATAWDDETYVSRVELYYAYSEDGNEWTDWQLVGEDANGEDGWSWEFFGSDGYYRFCSIAYDALGNKEEKELTEEASAGIDTVAPTSEVNDIVPYEHIGLTLELSYTASDDRSGVSEVKLYYRYSSDNETWSDWMEGDWTFHAPTAGYYQFYSIAIDNAGNVEAPPAEPDAICKFVTLEELKVNITRPVAGGIYFMDREIFVLPINLTIVIGKITISAEVENAYGDVEVEFIIDNESKFVDDSEPFNYTWNERAFSWHTIKVIAYDHYDDQVRTASAERDILILNFAFGGKTGIEGKVYDAQSWFKKGIAGASIIVYEHGTTNEIANTTTGWFLWKKGKFSIELNPGIYDLKVTAEGYETK
ncbi:MAG: hypothetical protein DRN13_01595, partial [Thermoplasmata archaeon]